MPWIFFKIVTHQGTQSSMFEYNLSNKSRLDVALMCCNSKWVKDLFVSKTNCLFTNFSLPISRQKIVQFKDIVLRLRGQARLQNQNFTFISKNLWHFWVETLLPCFSFWRFLVAPQKCETKLIRQNLGRMWCGPWLEASSHNVKTKLGVN